MNAKLQMKLPVIAIMLAKTRHPTRNTAMMYSGEMPGLLEESMSILGVSFASEKSIIKL